MTDDDFLADCGRVLDIVDGDDTASRELAYAAFEWCRLDAELAELVFDSAVDSGELVRSGGDARVLTFRSAEISIDVELSGLKLIGQVIPPTATAVEVVRPSGEVVASAVSDDLGVFVIDRMPDGPASLVVRAVDDAWQVRTPWTA